MHDTPALLARLAGEEGGRAWLGQLAAFLDRSGHRGPMEFDLGAPRWRDDPTMIVELVRAALVAPARETVEIQPMGRGTVQALKGEKGSGQASRPGA